MELVEKNSERAIMSFTKDEYVLLSDILRVFEHKMANGKIDYEMLMSSEAEANRFITRFFEVFAQNAR